MTIILRLEGLDVKAGAADIRRFFNNLRIPDGGVYIVGGSLREAFIAFSNEREAQLAMRCSGKFLKGCVVTLHVSNMDELEHKLKILLKTKKSSPTQRSVESPLPSPDTNAGPCSPNTYVPPTASFTREHRTANTEGVQPAASKRDPRTGKTQPAALTQEHRTGNNPNVQPVASTHDPRLVNLLQAGANLQPSKELDPSAALILGMCTILQGLCSSHQRENDDPVSAVDFVENNNTVVSSEARTPEQTPNAKPAYVRLFGLPASVTKEVICNFFKGLTVEEVVVNVKLGPGNGCLVKFASEQEARDAQLFNQQSLGSFCVEVRGATEKMWISALKECENTFVCESWKPKKSPLRETANHKQKSTALPIKRKSVNHFPYRSRKKPKFCDATASSPTEEYVVMVSQLPTNMTKTEIKELLGCPNIAHKDVQHLLDKQGNRTDTAFATFHHTEDYEYAMNLTGCHVGSGTIKVSSITKVMMWDMLARRSKDAEKEPCQQMKSQPAEMPSIGVTTSPQTCLFVRNLPADVTKSQLRGLFRTYRLKNNNIHLLLGSNGEGFGEAAIQFETQERAKLAQSLQGQNFRGSKLIITCINTTQMEAILANN